MLKTAAMVVVVVAVVMTMDSGRASESVSGSVGQWVSGTISVIWWVNRSVPEVAVVANSSTSKISMAVLEAASDTVQFSGGSCEVDGHTIVARGRGGDTCTIHRCL
jgi:hypothetical protein